MRTTNSARSSGPGDEGLNHVQSKARCLFIAWFSLAVTAGWVASIWTYRFLPMDDYPMWLYAGDVFSQLIRKHAASCYSIIPWPVPNTLFVGTLGLLDLLFDPETSGKIFLSFCVVLFALGSYRLVGAISTRRDSPLYLLPLLYVFHRSMWVGEISFSFSLGILFLAMARLLSRRDHFRSTDWWLITGLSLLIFFGHALSYICWLIILMLLCVFDSPRFSRPKALLAVGPSLLLMALYILNKGHPEGGSVALSLPDVVRSKFVLISCFSPLHFFSPFYWTDPAPLKLFAIVFNFSVVAIIFILAVIWVRRLPSYWVLFQAGTVRVALAAPLVFFAAFLVAPFQIVTGISDFNYRFLLPAFVTMLASFVSQSEQRLSESRRWTLTLSAAAAAMIVLGFQYFQVGRVSHKLQGSYEVISQAQVVGSDFRDLAENQFEHLGGLAPPSSPSGSRLSRLLPVHEPLAHFAKYFSLEQRTCVPVLSTSIIRTSVPYQRLLSDSKTMAYFPSAIVILGLQARNEAIAALMGDQFEMIADTESVLVLRRKAEASSASHQ